MALSGHLSFLPVVDVCLANWSLANVALPAPGLVLADGSDRAALVRQFRGEPPFVRARVVRVYQIYLPHV